jgi:hypothetical protein
MRAEPVLSVQRDLLDVPGFVSISCCTGDASSSNRAVGGGAAGTSSSSSRLANIEFRVVGSTLPHLDIRIPGGKVVAVVGVGESGRDVAFEEPVPSMGV